MFKVIREAKLVWLLSAVALCACRMPTDDAPVTCGGFANLPCPGGGICEDAPGDSCNPSSGGADCGGVCRCLQTALCIRDFEFDSSPEVCACVPSVTESPCALVDCRSGARCEVRGGEAVCVSDGP
jgi:hypothetical protein